MNKFFNICIIVLKELIYYALITSIMIYIFSVVNNLNKQKNIEKGYQEAYYSLFQDLQKCKNNSEIKEISRVKISSINYNKDEELLCKL